MNLKKKRLLAAKVLGVGAGRIRFNKERLSDIKESLTKQDIRDLFNDKAITLREVKGRMSKPGRTTRRRQGSVKRNFSGTKTEYIAITRRLRKYLSGMKRKDKISQEVFISLRKEIRARDIKDKNHLKTRIAQLSQIVGAKK